jgi:hypothetical protein
MLKICKSRKRRKYLGKLEKYQEYPLARGYNISLFFYLLIWMSGHLVLVSNNLMSPEVNDYVSLQWL